MLRFQKYCYRLSLFCKMPSFSPYISNKKGHDNNITTFCQIIIRDSLSCHQHSIFYRIMESKSSFLSKIYFFLSTVRKIDYSFVFTFKSD